MGHSTGSNSNGAHYTLLDSVQTGFSDLKYKLGFRQKVEERGVCHGLKHDIREDYDLKRGIIKLLDNGEFKECRSKQTKQMHYVKVHSKKKLGEQECEAIIQEALFIKTLDHTNIIKIIDIYEDSKHIYIVEEYFQGTDLFDSFNKQELMTEKDVANIMHQIVSGMYHCH